jgi:hypothetical protein
MQTTKAGEPLFVDLECLVKAAELKGFVKVDTNEYKWWGRSVGDYPTPPGVRTEDIGKNALFVLRMNDEKLATARSKYGEAYEIGVIADPNNPGCYTVMYDFYNSGYGIDDLVGAPARDQNGAINLLCPQLKQAYDMVCDAHAAAESGDKISFMTMREAHAQHPDVFPASTDETTWVSVVDTENRVGVR